MISLWVSSYNTHVNGGAVPCSVESSKAKYFLSHAVFAFCTFILFAVFVRAVIFLRYQN